MQNKGIPGRSRSQKTIEKQTSGRKKARSLSISLPQSGIWLLAARIPAPGLHLLPNEFHVAVKYRLGAPIHEKNESVLL